MTKAAFIGILSPDYEDGGQAIICEGIGDEKEGGMFVKVQSWDHCPTGSVVKERKYGHRRIRKFLGKKVLITVEVLD